jgi:hypothetical protein
MREQKFKPGLRERPVPINPCAAGSEATEIGF